MQNKHISYAPDSLVHIRCPANIIDLMKQRKRIWIGHIQLKHSTGYKVSTSSFRNMLRAVAALGLRDILCLLPGGFLEAVAYLQARIAVKKGDIPYIWEPIRSTKTSLSPTNKPVSEEIPVRILIPSSLKSKEIEELDNFPNLLGMDFFEKGYKFHCDINKEEIFFEKNDSL